MSKYFFLHPKTLKVCTIYQGRSLWEDHINKAEFIVVKTVGPAMDHWEEAMALPLSANVLEDAIRGLTDRGYPQDTLDAVLKKLQE